MFLTEENRQEHTMTGKKEQKSAAAAQLEELFADDWEFTLREHPQFATSVGDHRFDDKLSAVSEADHERRLAQERTFLKRLDGIDRKALGAEDQLNYDIY